MTNDIAKIIRSSTHFDPDWYLRTYPDVANSGLDPAEHYLRFGMMFGRDPGPDFSAALYLHHNPDVAKAGVDPLVHYERRGRAGNRKTFRSDANAAPVDPAITASEIDRRRLRLTPEDARAEILRILSAQPPKPVTRIMTCFDHDKARHFTDCLMSLPGEELAARRVKASVVLPTYNRASTLGRAIRSVLTQSHHDLELLVVDDGSTDDTDAVLRGFQDDTRLRVFRNAHRGVSAARNTALEHATGDMVFYLDSDNFWTVDFVRLMIMALRISGASCAYGAMRLEDGAGWLMGYRGEAFDRAECIEANYVDMNVFCHRREMVAKYGGFDPVLKRTVDWDLILRYTRSESMVYCPIIGCTYVHDNDDPNRISVSRPFIFRDLVQEKHRGDHATTADAIAAMKLRVSIKIAAPHAEREAWGDYHYAQSLKEALERQGHEAVIDFRGDWYKRKISQDHVAIVLRGLVEYKPRPGQLSLMWNISHPDQVRPDEYDAFHGIFVASSSWAALLGQVLGRPVETLLQCTDRSRFAFALQPPPHNGAGVFVGNSRKVYRDIVRWSVDAGLALDVHGQHWEDFIPSDMIISQNIPNTELARTYASAAFVLNDHWASMRDFGFVSNRVFDVLGCGGRLVSDDLPSIRALFGDAVMTVKDEADFRARMSSGVPMLPATLRRATAQTILRGHTFDARARTLVGWVRDYLSAEAALPKPVRDDRLKVGVFAAREDGHPTAAALVRLLAPLTTDDACTRLRLVTPTEVEDATIDRLDACIVQQGALVDPAEAERLIARLAERGVPLFVDTSPLPDEATLRLIAAATEVWTDTVSTGVPDVFAGPRRALANRLDPRLWRNYRTKREAAYAGGKLRILWPGDATAADFAPVHAALRRLAASHPDRFELVVTGNLPAPCDEGWISRCVPPDGVTSHPARIRWLNGLPGFDIGIATADGWPGMPEPAFQIFSALGALSLLPRAPESPSENACESRAIAGGLALGYEPDADALCDVLRQIMDNPAAYDGMRKAAQDRLWDHDHALAQPGPMIARIEDAQRNRPEPQQDAPASADQPLVIGKDGWLFSRASLMRPRPQPGFEEAWHRLFMARAEASLRQGFGYYFAIIPDRNRVCARFLPTNQIGDRTGGAPANPATVDQVLRAAAGVVHHRDLMDGMRTALLSQPVFAKGESRWTDTGAAVAFNQVMADLGLPPLDRDEYDEYSEEIAGDLSARLDRMTETTRITLKAPRFQQVERIGARGAGSIRIFRNNDRSLPTATVFGDLIVGRQAEMLASRFSRLVLVMSPALDMALIRRETPDFVISLQAEQTLPHLPQDHDSGLSEPLKTPRAIPA